MKTLIAPLLSVLALSVAVPALAETPDTTGGDATAVVKAATGVEARQPVGEATHFKKGEHVFVWSEVKGANGQTVDHVWKKEGKEVRRIHFEIGSRDWRVNSRMTTSAGSYVVEVTAGDKVLGAVNFTVE